MNPVVDWSYEQIWTFIKDFDIPYCKLYNEGTFSMTKGTLIWEASTIQRKTPFFLTKNKKNTSQPMKHRMKINISPGFRSKERNDSYLPNYS